MSLLGFDRLATRAPHGAYARCAKRNRVDRRSRMILLLASVCCRAWHSARACRRAVKQRQWGSFLDSPTHPPRGGRQRHMGERNRVDHRSHSSALSHARLFLGPPIAFALNITGSSMDQAHALGGSESHFDVALLPSHCRPRTRLTFAVHAEPLTTGAARRTLIDVWPSGQVRWIVCRGNASLLKRTPFSERFFTRC